MLLQPLEEQLDLPPVVIQFRHFQRADVQSIGKEDKLLAGFGIKVYDSPYLLRILAHGQLSVHISGGIGEYAGWQPAFPSHRLEVVVLPTSDYEVCSDTVYGEEPCEVIVCAVEDVERALLVWNGIHRFCIVLSGRCDMEECRYLGLNIIQCMYLDTAFLFPEQSPLKDAQAQVNRGGVKDIHLSSKLEYLDCPTLLCIRHDPVGELFKYVIVPVAIGICESAFGDMLSEAQVKSLACVRLCRKNQVSETLTVGQLSEHHDCQLIPAGERLDITIPVVFI